MSLRYTPRPPFLCEGINVMLNCSNANKIQCRPDLFGAWFWECGFVADLSHSRLPHRLCLLILPIPSNAWLVLDSVLDYFIMPGVISSWVMTPFLTDADAKCNKLLFKRWILGSWTLLRRLLEERWNIFKWPSRKSSYPHMERLRWPGCLESIGCLYTRYNLTFIGVCCLFVGGFVDPRAPHPWNSYAWYPMSSKVSFHWIS